MKSLIMYVLAIIPLLGAAGCNFAHRAAVRRGYPPPALSRDVFAGDFWDKEDRFSHRWVEGRRKPPSLYERLTGDDDLPEDPGYRFLTRLTPHEGDRFRITLLDGHGELRSTVKKWKLRKGYLDCGTRFGGKFFVIVNFCMSSSAALGATAKGDLVLWWESGGVLLLVGFPIAGGGGPAGPRYLFERKRTF